MALQQLSAQDAQFIYMQTPENLTHVAALYVYDPATAPGGTVRFKDIIEHVRSRLHISPVFRRKLHRLPMDIDHPYWVEDKHFDIEAHISHGRLPEPADWRQFTIHVARHFSKPMDMARPLWDMYVIEGLGEIDGYGEGAYAILTRVHHAAIDGAAAAHFFTALNDRDTDGNPLIEVEATEWDFGDVPEPVDTVTRAWMNTATSPVRLLDAAMKLTPTMVKAAQRTIRDQMNDGEGTSGAESSAIPKTRFNGSVTPHKMFDATTFDLEELKAIRKKVGGATINDVVLAVCSGALRRYLSHHDELPDRSLVAVAPVNTRKKDDPSGAMGNQITAMSVKLSTDIADPLKRLAAIRDTTRETKAARAGLSARVMTDLSQHIPGATMSGAARLLSSERFAPMISNLFVSNVPGPQQAMYMNAAKLTHQYGLGPLAHKMGLFIATPSYNGTMSFAITTDRGIMPDIAFFRDCLNDSFAELRDAKGTAALAKPPADEGPPAGDEPIQDAAIMYRRVSPRRRPKAPDHESKGTS